MQRVYRYTWEAGVENEIKRVGAAPIYGEVDCWQGPSFSHTATRTNINL
jgi:hypothetical protein